MAKLYGFLDSQDGRKVATKGASQRLQATLQTDLGAIKVIVLANGDYDVSLSPAIRRGATQHHREPLRQLASGNIHSEMEVETSLANIPLQEV